jgi:Arc/MetJ family transcription regulator
MAQRASPPRSPARLIPTKPSSYHIYRQMRVYTSLLMAKHLVDIDEQALRDARDQLGARTIKETVNRALRLAGGDHPASVKERLDTLAGAELVPREQAWR